MAKAKKPPKVADTATETDLNAKRELFCRFYTQNDELFGNATLSYAAAYGYDLDSLSHEAEYEEGEDDLRVKVDDSPYDKAFHVCAVEASKLLKNPEVQTRKVELLNELLRDDVVDSELAKVIKQDEERAPKVQAIREYNKVQGRIIDKTKIITEKFSVDDIRALLAPLPQERQDEIYAILTNAIADAELLRSGTQGKGSDPQ